MHPRVVVVRVVVVRVVVVRTQNFLSRAALVVRIQNFLNPASSGSGPRGSGTIAKFS